MPRENCSDVNGTANNGGSFVVAHRYDVNEVGRVRHTYKLLPKQTEPDSIIEFTISFTPNRKECTVTAKYPPEEEGRNISPFPSPRNLRPAQDCSTRFQFDFVESPGGSGHSFRNMTYSRSPMPYDLGRIH